MLGEETEELLPPLLAAAPLERAARHAAQRARLVTRLASSLKTLEETVEMARLTGLPLRTIANQAQMVRTENLMLKAATTLELALPLGRLPAAVAWPQSQMIDDAMAFQHWPWPLAELDTHQRTAIERGVAGHCTRTALRQDGSAGLHVEPVVVLDYASLYPSVFIAHNLCYSTLLRQQAHSAARAPAHHRTPNTVGPNTRVAGAVGDNDSRVWRGDGIAFVTADEHTGLMPRLLQALLRERRVVKARIKQLTADDVSGGGGGGGGSASGTNSDLVAVLDARQLVLKLLAHASYNPNPNPDPDPNPHQVLKLLANASYGFCGADTSHLCCKPLVSRTLTLTLTLTL